MNPDGTLAAPCSTPLGPQLCTTPNMNGSKPDITATLPGSNSFFIAYLTKTTVPDALFFNYIPTHDLVGQPPIRLITVDVAKSIAQGFQVALVPELAIVQLRMFDCTGAPASGVYFTLDSSVPSPAPDGILPFAYQNSSPTNLFLTTDPTGQFGFANVGPGNVRVTAYLANPKRTLPELTAITKGKMMPPADDTLLTSMSIPLVRGGWATLADVRLFVP
jgi:hypothetical protein